MSAASPGASAAGNAGAAGAKEQVARLLTLVPYLHARGTVRLAEAAAALGIRPEVLLKDLKVLFMCGLPGGYPDELIDVDLDALQDESGKVHGDGVIRVSNADYLDRPLRLTPVEASAMIVALRALRSGSAPDTAEIVDRVLAKLEGAAAAGPTAGVVDAAPEESESSELTALAARLDDASRRQVQVELDYYVPARDELSHRVVDPRGMVREGGHAYLDAWCHSAEAPRLFRLDRVAAARVLDTPVTTEPAEPRDLSDGMFARSDETTLVTLRLAPAARWVTEYYPVEDVRPLPDGEVEVDLLVADERWLTKLLLRLAPNAWVTAPTTYGGGLARAAQDALSLYQ
ncbi:YafY family protein [Nocardioides sp.]|uniref:helix-turn-helix transcriptional regulator n=1 Tax=Nocardioides sp. TaxID=35761 RepID=UPI00271EA4FD|nr:WYL domain-containing protein [Nocardioides sp.]MDO9454604.1 WYL domain-containing protein [Nocardioides sp.]